MTFFFDNNLSIKIVRGLREFGEDVVHLQEHFHSAIDDVKLFQEIAKEGWVLITADKKIKRKAHELKALISCGIGVFIFSKQHLSACDWIRLVVRRWSDIKKFAPRQSPPYIYRVPVRGKIERLKI